MEVVGHEKGVMGKRKCSLGVYEGMQVDEAAFTVTCVCVRERERLQKSV